MLFVFRVGGLRFYFEQYRLSRQFEDEVAWQFMAGSVGGALQSCNNFIEIEKFLAMLLPLVEVFVLYAADLSANLRN